MSDIRLQFLGQQPDIEIRNDSFGLVTGEEAIEQQLRLRLKFFLGEFFLDAQQGIPFLREVFVKNPNLDLLRSIFTEAIDSCPGIASVDQLDLNIDAALRTLNLYFIATMDTGEELVFSPFILEI